MSTTMTGGQSVPSPPDGNPLRKELPLLFRSLVRRRSVNVVAGCALLVLFGQLLGLTAGCAQTQETPPPRQPLANWLEKAKGEDGDQRVLALEAFAQYPENAAELFYPLLDGIVHPDSMAKAAATHSITALAEPLAAHASSLLSSTDNKVLAAACDMISRTGKAGQVALPQLLTMMQSDSERLQTYALFAARNLESDNPELMTQALRFVDNPDFQKQIIAIDILRGYGAAAKEAVPRIKAVSETGNPSVRIHALEALGGIGPLDDFDVVAFLVERLNAFLQPEREGALKGLGRLGPAAAAARDPIERLLADPSKGNQCQAALALWRISGDPQETLDMLKIFAGSSDLEEDAIFALAEMGPAAQPAAKFVASKLQTEDESFRLSLLDVLAAIEGVAATRDTIKKLATSDPNILVRTRAQELLR